MTQPDPRDAALTRIQQMTDYWEQNLPEVIRTPAVVSAIRAALERVADPAGPAPATDQAALRERIAEAIHRNRFPDSSWERQHDVVRADYLDCADAILAVLPAPDQQTAAPCNCGAVGEQEHDWDCDANLLPYRGEHGYPEGEAPADRAAVLLEAAALLDQRATGIDAFASSDYGEEARAVRELADAANELRRLAGEAQQDEVACTCFVVNDGGVHAESCAKRAREARQDPTQDGEALPSSTAPLAAGLPLVKGNCPACRRASLFLGTGGYPTCANADCTEPDAATTVLEQYANEAHPPQHAWRVETRDPLANEWAPGSHFASRPHAVERYETANRHAPLWRDGTPVERRIVRETTTYTVEQPTVVARPGQPETDTEAGS